MFYSEKLENWHLECQNKENKYFAQKSTEPLTVGSYREMLNNQSLVLYETILTHYILSIADIKKIEDDNDIEKIILSQFKLQYRQYRKFVLTLDKHLRQIIGTEDLLDLILKYLENFLSKDVHSMLKLKLKEIMEKVNNEK